MNPSGSFEDISAFEIIKKSKQLLDIGAITQEEFEEIKKIYLIPFSDEKDEIQEIKSTNIIQKRSNEQKQLTSKISSEENILINDSKDFNNEFTSQSWHTHFDSNDNDLKQSNTSNHKKYKSKMNTIEKIKHDGSYVEKPLNINSSVDIFNSTNVLDENNDGEKYKDDQPWYYSVSSSKKINPKTKQKKVKKRGSKLHTISNKKIEPKHEVNSKPIYQNYKLQTNKLQLKFKSKEKNLRNLIEKCFPSPQITNTRFNHNIDECSEIFSHKMKSIMIIIDSTNDYSPKIEEEIKSDIDVLKQIMGKIDSLHDELLIQMSGADNDDFENLLDEMDILINSVKNYVFDN